MTQSDIPSGGDSSNLEKDFQAFLEREQLLEIEDNEYTAEFKAVEDTLLARLVEDKFPLVPQIIEINSTLFDESSDLHELYDFLVGHTPNSEVQLGALSPFNQNLIKDPQANYLMYNLVGVVQKLAAAKCYQDELLRQAQLSEETGSLQGAETYRHMADEARLEAEAELFLDDSLGPNIATRILSAVAPEFYGESLLPLDTKSESYIMMHRLKQEKTYEARDEVKLYAEKAQEILETMLKPGQIQHPEFGEFAVLLCRAIARNVLAPQHTVGLSTEQIEAYTEIIGLNIRMALEKAAELGIDEDNVREMYAIILSKLM